MAQAALNSGEIRSCVRSEQYPVIESRLNGEHCDEHKSEPSVVNVRISTFNAINVATGIGGGPNNYPRWEQRKYTSQEDDYALAKWEEAWLIEAQVAGGQTAIDLVNEIRAHPSHNLPQISGAYLTELTDGVNDAQDIQVMLIEEVRRTFFLEGGRWWSHKLRYNLWFPRTEDQDQWNFTYQGGVRMVFPNGEFDLNPNLVEDDQGSLCPAGQEPIV